MISARALAAGGGALLAGVTLPLAFAPFGAWPFAILAPAALLALLLGCSPRVAFVRGWLFGLGLFGSGASWVYVSIHDYGSAPVPLAAALTLLFCAGLGLFPAILGGAWARWLRGRPGGVLLGFPAAWIATDWVRGWILTGFPWLYPGYSQLDGPLAGWVPVVGVFGIGLILVFSAAVIVVLAGLFPLPRPLSRMRERGEEALHSRPRSGARERGVSAPLPYAGEGGAQRRERVGPIAAALLCAVLWLAAGPLARIEWTAPLGEPRSVAMVQGNIPQLLKWDPDHLDNTIAVYRELSAPLWGADLVVWPESAIPAYLDRVTDFLSAQATLAVGAGSALLLGIPTRDGDPDDPRGYRTFNSVIALGADSGMYHKRHLVPFGEYVPLEQWLRGLIAFFDLPMSGFSRGPEQQALLTAGGLGIGTFVCYEIAYPELVRDRLPAAALLLTVSNDTWFGASVGPLQHLEIARLRALENGRDLLRATNNGVSVLTDHRGRITARGAQFSREVIRGTVQPRTGLTPFARLGSWPVLSLCALMLALPLARRGSPQGD